MHLQPVERWTGELEPKPAGLLPFVQVIPMERMLRMIWAGDSSKEQYRAFAALAANPVEEGSGEARLAGAACRTRRCCSPV